MGRKGGRRSNTGIRNVLIHGYASINDLTVWHTIDESLPILYKTLTTRLDEADSP